MSNLTLNWLGSPSILWNDQPVKLETRKATALLCYLSLERVEKQRELLATMFWPDGTQQKALANLRRTLSSINASLPGWIEARRDTVLLKENGSLWIDVLALRQTTIHLKQHKHTMGDECDECLVWLRQATEYFQGEFLEGFNLADAPDFDEWQFYIRDEIRQEIGIIFERLSRLCAKRRDDQEAVQYARRWVALDRLYEPANRLLMELYGRLGQRNAAIRHYEELAQILKEQMKQEPEAETRALYDQLRRPRETPLQNRDPVTIRPSDGLPLLKTKLYIPAKPGTCINRQRLTAQLDEAVRKALTVISAPAGFGKTTLLAEWITRIPLAAAWLSLDNGDNDAYRFLSYLIAALENVQEGIGIEARQLMFAGQPAPVTIILASLINDLGGIAEPFLLILDDYQFIVSHAVHEILGYILDHCPANLHIVIATRTDPPLQLGRLRAYGQLSELRTQDLRFTAMEAAEFLNTVMQLDLSPSDIHSLDNRTEGWVVGLQMAALSLKGHTNASDFIQAFSGSHRFVLDYLLEEVLGRQPSYIQTFLIYTSILEKLHSSLCNELMPEEWLMTQKSEQPILEYLEKNNLFLVPLDEHKQWFRYHHLFAELLQSRLQQYHAETIRSLHIRAADWFEKQDLFLDAISHSLVVQDYPRAIRLLEQIALQLLANNELATYNSILKRIPDNVVGKYPWLRIYQACIYSRLGNISEIEVLLQEAEKSIDQDNTNPQTEEMIGCIALVRANVANLQGNTTCVIEQTEKALRLVPQKNLITLGYVDFQLGYAHYINGDFSKAKAIWERVAELAIASRDLYTYANAIAEVANLYKLQGKLHQAFKIYDEGRQRLTQNFPRSVTFLGVLKIGLADLLREWNRLDESNQLVLEGIEHAIAGGRPNTLCHGHVVKARISRARQDILGAIKSIDDAERIANEHTLFPMSVARLEAEKVRLWLSQSYFDKLEQWIEKHSSGSTFDYFHELEHITLARIFIAKDMPGEAFELLERQAHETKKGERTERLIEIRILQALAMLNQVREKEAQSFLINGLRLAEGENYYRIFTDEGEPLLRLLKSVQTLESPAESMAFINQLLGASE